MRRHGLMPQVGRLSDDNSWESYLKFPKQARSWLQRRGAMHKALF